MTTALAFDPGHGGVIVYGSQGGLNMPSAVSVGDSRRIRRMLGLRSARSPMRITTEAGEFYIGEGAHDWGRPVENLDFDRPRGAPEMLALFLGVMTQYGLAPEPATLMVGLPIATLMGDEASATKRKVRGFLRGKHSWVVDGVEQSLTVRDVLDTAQPVGAMFDYLLTDSGTMTPDKRAAFKSEIGILGIGMNTVELLVVRNGTPLQRFTAGETLGVRRLLELVGLREAYSLTELDVQLRAGSLDVKAVLPVWQSEVLGFVERQWGRKFRRFKRVAIVGGGAVLLRDSLLQRFRGKAFIPGDPIIATARGLYKYTLMRARRGSKRGKAGTASES